MDTIKKISAYFLVLALVFTMVANVNIGESFAQQAAGTDMSAAEKEAQRNQYLQQIKEEEDQIKELEASIDKKKTERKTLSGELSIINQQIKKQELEIKRTKLRIDQLKLDIQDKNQKIADLEQKARLEKVKLIEDLNKLNEYDKVGLLEMMLNYDNLSDFFTNVTAVENLQRQTYAVLQDIHSTKDSLISQIESLQDDETEATQLKSMMDLQKFSLGQKQTEKNKLIADTKGQENKFQQLIKQHRQKIADIQSRMFQINSFGVGKITIESAVKYAQVSGSQTGIRPAFLLGLIWVESRLNSNLGTGNWKTDLYDCYVRLGKRSMAETQKDAFLSITSKLMVDPNKAPVSKALTSVGCGGAMGVAQFMPATWAAYESRIAAASGNNPPSPWNVLDGFVGSAIKLADNGATSQDRAGERRAAAMYYAGKNWQRAPGQGYADRVRTAAACYQSYMDALKKGEQNIEIDSDCEKYF